MVSIFSTATIIKEGPTIQLQFLHVKMCIIYIIIFFIKGSRMLWGSCFKYTYTSEQSMNKLEIQYIARPLRHFQWDLVSKHLYDLVFLSIACLVTCMHIILFRHNLNFHFYYQARYTLSEFIVSPSLLVVFNYFVLQNFGLISMHICSLTLFIFKIVLRTFPVKF